ncbi:MAG: asparagine--tRNA ligase, partial [Saprospiraceae bacterium]|nr:asparagine--tRNA ligase [Saprospiraceae bacterium]
MAHQYIKDLSVHEGKKVQLKGWASNIRSGKGIFFILMRDGSGYCQAVVSQDGVSAEAFEEASSLTQESSFWVEGNVIKDEKQIGGYEIQVTDMGVYSIALEYPISNKEHGVTFLSNNRHLWLRSRRQWAIMRIRNEIIMGIHDFFQKDGYVQMDAPIFTGSAVEGTTTLFET